MTLEYINFPDPPLLVGQIHVKADISWVWDGEKWITGPAGLQVGYMPITGGDFTGAISAPAYEINHVLFANSDDHWHFIYDKSGQPAILLGAADTGDTILYRATAHTFTSNDGSVVFAQITAGGIYTTLPVSAKNLWVDGSIFAQRHPDGSLVIHDAQGDVAIALYGASHQTVYRNDYHTFQNNNGTNTAILDSTGKFTVREVDVNVLYAATSIHSDGDITATGNISGTDIHATGNMSAVNLNIDNNIAAASLGVNTLAVGGTITVTTVAASGTVSANLVTANSISSNTSVNASQYNLRGAMFAQMDAGANYTQISDPGLINLTLYASGINYYDNAEHIFRSRGASYGAGTTYAIFSAGGTFNQTGSWGVISDDSVKENVAPYTAGLAQVKQLNPVSFQYTAAAPMVRALGETNYGLMASEVAPVVPEMLGETDLEIDGVPSPVQTLVPTHLVYLLVNAVKELSARVEQLEAANP